MRAREGDVLRWLKRIASLLLLLCMFLPLSKCSGKADPATGKAGADTMYYGYKMIADAAPGLGKMSLTDHALTLAMLATFLAPICSLALRGNWEPGLVLAAALPSGGWLWEFVFGFPDAPMAGGILAILCWIVLLALSLAQLRRGPGPAAPAP